MVKSTTKTLIAAGLLSASALAQAGLSANIGASSEYYFRGYDLSEGPMMSGGLDYEADNGLYAGVWVAGFENPTDASDPATSEDNELEYDIYGGYAGEFGDISYSVGYTGYFYKEADISFHELNFNFGYEFLSLEATFGTEDDDTSADATDDDYTFIALTGEYEGAYLTLGTYGKDYDGDYAELGYGTSFQGLDFGVAYVSTDSDIDSDGMYFTIGKSFDL
ncbi:TorF family putative porin [Neptuniibacter sp. PT8_73]|uniref:TorF family putative porin n=1 Tax=unclassified Neptuniibacter TaxID=2630693 RepID=UPI0039F6B1D7